MKIDLNRSDGSTNDFEIAIASADLELEADLAKAKDDVKVAGTVTNGERVTVIEADVTAPLTIFCSRCLEEIPTDLEFGFRTAFVPTEEATDDQEVELDLQDLDLSFAEEDEVDLVDVIREQMILNIPARPLCKDDCKGLCEVCGKNLNRESCECKNEESDPRWAALKNLK